MPVYRILRLKESLRPAFRSAPHASGTAEVKVKDYQQDGSIEASTPYGAWTRLRETEERLHVGDLLENPEGDLRIYKFVGFEPARWLQPASETPGEVAAAVKDSASVSDRRV